MFHTILVKNSYMRRQWQKCWLRLEMLRKSATIYLPMTLLRQRERIKNSSLFVQNAREYID